MSDLRASLRELAAKHQAACLRKAEECRVNGNEFATAYEIAESRVATAMDEALTIVEKFVAEHARELREARLEGMRWVRETEVLKGMLAK
jgi:hypothetical protein